MVMKKALLLSLFAASYVHSACDESVKVESNDDLGSVVSCSKFKGDITIKNTPIAGINFGGLSEVDGSIFIENNKDLNNIYLSGLEKITGQLFVGNNTKLSVLNVDKLSEVKEFRAINNPNMGEVTFHNISSIETIQIIQTSVSNLGIVSAESLKNIEITSNKKLDSIGFPNLTETSGYVLFADNGKNGKVSLPELAKINGNCSFSDLSELDIGKLKSVGSDFTISANSFKNITIRTLEKTGKAVTISENSALENITFPNLTDIGGSLNIQNNTKMTYLYPDSFPKLKSISGSIVLIGPFDNASFTAISHMDGSLSMKSTGDINCDGFKKNVSSYIKNANKVTCKGNVKNNSSKKGDKKDSDGSSDDSDSGANPVQFLGLVSTFALVAGTFLF
ncbi:cell wall protein Ecm33 [Mycoemilia scoparia]|uniref:Cell wall protein Ecm33 n=1 Tax=Mycoemilia scoparia TaxID=417184 RepID=A0A9W7ZTL1_9FUNG|nr:cell wall protein Ecm33 [Mycoemilia scoparia]